MVKNLIKTLTLALAISLLASTPALATLYYVGPNPDMQKLKKFGVVYLQSFSKAVGARPGDTIYVGTGTFKDKVTLTTSGTTSNPITITAAPGEKPVFDGAMIYIASGVSNIVISGLEIKNVMDDSGIRLSLSTNNVTIRDCVIHNIGLNGIYLAGAGHVAENNKIYDVGQSNYKYKTHCIYVKADNARAVANDCSGAARGNGIRAEGNNVLISRNRVYKNYEHGISLFADVPTSGFTIEQNEVFDNGKGDGIAILGGSGGNAPNGVVISQNKVYNNEANLTVGGGSKNVKMSKNELRDALRYQVIVDAASLNTFSYDGNSITGNGALKIGNNYYATVQDYSKTVK